MTWIYIVFVVFLYGCMKDPVDITWPTIHLESAEPQYGTIAGFVYNAKSQSGIPNVKVVAAGIGAWTNNYGYFELPKVPAGSDSIKATVAGYHNASGAVNVVVNQMVEYSIGMIPY